MPDCARGYVWWPLRGRGHWAGAQWHRGVRQSPRLREGLYVERLFRAGGTGLAPSGTGGPRLRGGVWPPLGDTLRPRHVSTGLAPSGTGGGSGVLADGELFDGADDVSVDAWGGADDASVLFEAAAVGEVECVSVDVGDEAACFGGDE